MHGSVPIDVGIARNDAARTGQEFFIPTASGNILPPNGWFMRIAHSLWPEKPAAWLRYFTGFPERTCRSAANGHTEVSSPMLYALLRGEQGDRVLDSIMDGSDAEWWLRRQRECRIGASAIAAMGQ